MKNFYSVIGLMSGTSLDGLDVACCNFTLKDGKWSYRIGHAETFEYGDDFKSELKHLHKASAYKFAMVNRGFGIFCGKLTRVFINEYNLKPDLICSHGHTIFHEPANGMTFQIGSGAHIAAITGVETVCDFRSGDVASGGQGAPLVPIGDALLFSEYDFCLNLGGISNISASPPAPLQGERGVLAFDICPVNMALNYLASLKGFEFDDGGKMAAKGNVNNVLLKKLNALDFYAKNNTGPKSLGKEWFEKYFLPLIDDNSILLHDRLRTVCEHIAVQITLAIKKNANKKGKKMLVTGGGAFNTFLIELLKQKTNVEIVIPAKKIVEFKEALIFAFLGLLRKRNEINILKSVTGAKRDSIGGCIYLP